MRYQPNPISENAKTALIAGISALAAGGAVYLFTRPAAAATAPAGPVSWPATTFTGGAANVNPSLNIGQGSGGAFVVLQDTQHGGPNGSLILVQTTGLDGSGNGTGVVRSAVAPPNVPGASPIQNAQTVNFKVSDVVASANDMGTALQILSQA